MTLEPTLKRKRLGTPPSTEKQQAGPIAYQFPPACFAVPQVSVAALKGLTIPLEERTYCSIGGGLGSFAWVDLLRIYGVPAEQIVSIGFEAKPHGRYQRLCRNSQIPDEERLRSDAAATPDNIWGWPGYALREMWDDCRVGRIGNAARIGWQVFTEPVFAEPFTPKAGRVYDSIEREATRIDWDQIWRYGRVRAIRKTNDGRYAIAYSQSNATRRAHRIMIARYLHLAVGYSGFRFLPDLQAYRADTGDFRSVVNAYEDHNHVYRTLRRHGGTVLIRGRGIVASRIIQRLAEERAHNPAINVVHLMRSPRPAGSRYEHNQRRVENHFEQQPFNFPKAAFGGDLRARLAQASDEERQELIAVWGGTTTADRRDWREIIDAGLREGWYQIRFGQVEQVTRNDQGKVIARIKGNTIADEDIRLQTDFVIDATGLDADLDKNPLLKDLLEIYHLEKNMLGRLSVTENYEVEALRNGDGRLFASGAMTLGGPYAPVDSFVGLQYTAQLAVEYLSELKAPGLKMMTPARSLQQWIRWAKGVRP